MDHARTRCTLPAACPSRRGKRAAVEALVKQYDRACIQVQKLKMGGSEVAFRAAVKDGKVNFTARALKGAKNE
jgi:hypothetical protein